MQRPIDVITHACSDCCEKEAMRYPGSKGIHVMSIIIIIWFRFHTAHINNDIIILISNKRMK